MTNLGIEAFPQKFPFMASYLLTFYEPNQYSVSGATAHTIQHLLESYLTKISQYKDEVISIVVFPDRNSARLELVANHKMDIKSELIKAIRYSIELNAIPGRTKYQCRNYLSHNLEDAKAVLAYYTSVLIKVSEQYLDSQYKIANGL